MNKKRGAALRAIASLLAIVLPFVVAAACLSDGGPELVVENRLAVSGALYDRGRLVEDIGAGKVFDYTILKFGGVRRYELRDSVGTVLAARCYTWAELKGQHWRIVFDSPQADMGSHGKCL